MLGITEAPAMASREPNTRSSINDAATEMGDLIEAEELREAPGSAGASMNEASPAVAES